MSIECWGADMHGQASVPVMFRLRQNKRISSLSAGAAHTCAIISTFDTDNH